MEGRQRVVIENMQPMLDCGKYPIKRAVGETVTVEAGIFADGHDSIVASLLYKKQAKSVWQTVGMTELGNDRWQAGFAVSETGIYEYTIKAWIDHFKAWQRDIEKKFNAGQDIGVDLLIGARHITQASNRAAGEAAQTLLEFARSIENKENQQRAFQLAMDPLLVNLMEQYPDQELASRYAYTLKVKVERSRALFSAWYELFPRSANPQGKHGTFTDVEKLLPEIADMGFNVLYLPPIHPIGISNRKGKNNSIKAKADDPGSPWAIGSPKGGHKSIHPKLGTLADFKKLVKKAQKYNLEIALDLAYQCSPDHPWVTEHPDWFRWRPDGTVQYAENPPKKYQDILPINFETPDWQALWQELKSVVDYWIEQGVTIFRVDNPHTKPFLFWEWMIKKVRDEHPDVIFLAEAFTRPAVMYRLAKIGFTQSYTYFTWRNTTHDFVEYMTELTQLPVREYFRPNFWPNTPDILPQHLQFDHISIFLIRFLLAATLSSNYGIYGPAFELCEKKGLPGREEYANSEKYEIRKWNRNQSKNIKKTIKQVNHIRNNYEAFQQTNNLHFIPTGNDQLLAFIKTGTTKNINMMVVINMDPHYRQSGFVEMPIGDLEIEESNPYMVHDLVSDEKYIWQGSRNYIELGHETVPAHIFRIYPRLPSEEDFDYYM
ncbi:DUF3416 domain-containing protein [candidate division KSB1 bacterium]|nr:DUF3416 domain-containing protein [candidate division KSB1 bacterium]